MAPTSCRVGVASMDSQHKQWITLINRLYASITQGDAAKTVGTILKDLLDYTDYHFKAEEELMEKANLLRPSRRNGKLTSCSYRRAPTRCGVTKRATSRSPTIC